MNPINAAGMDETYGTYVDEEYFDIHDYDGDTDHDTDNDTGGDTDDDSDDDTDDDTADTNDNTNDVTTFIFKKTDINHYFRRDMTFSSRQMTVV